MKIGKFTKTPTERKRYQIDYTNWLDTGETVATRAFTVEPTGSLVVDASLILTGNKAVSFFVNGGDDGETYKVVVTITTSGGQTKEDLVYFSVRDV